MSAKETTFITKFLRKLPKADFPPVVTISQRPEDCGRERYYLCVTRNGNPKVHLIPRFIAEELISLGLAYGR